MYDYVLQFGFDNETQSKVQNIKQFLKEKGIKDKERNWLPHITIDLFNCEQKDIFINQVDELIETMSSFDIIFKNLNNFDKETLYIEPYNKKELMEIKKRFDEKLDKYRLEKRKQRVYSPHVTLCTNENIEDALELALKVFTSFSGKVKFIWIYNEKMKLIKQYELK